MIFNSIDFLIFFPIVTLCYFLIPHRFRWSLLLIASCIFYMSFIPQYILILFLTIIIDYFAAIYIEKSKEEKKRKIFLTISIISTIFILFIFKYFNFFNENVAKIAQFIGWNYSLHSLSLILPIGLSFHTFQSLSYVIEVYYGRQKAEKHFGIYSLYVMFYPQLVAGPIERPQNLLHQFYEKHNFRYTQFKEGLKLMIWGFFKKVVIANNLAIIVNLIYDKPQEYYGILLIIATIFFAFQIFCDFSGYSDIALGAAQIMGFKLMINFNRPYYAKSISEFWRRWHISLSTWFKDYVYIPLGGNRVSVPRWYLNLFIIFLISGIWHGANWTFIIWGALHGIFMVIGIMTEKTRNKLNKFFRIYKIPAIHNLIKSIIVFIMVCFTWIFFRANKLTDAYYIITHMFTNIRLNINEIIFELGKLHITKAYFIIMILSILLMEIVHMIQEGVIKLNYKKIHNNPLSWIILILIILLFGGFNNIPFIYFQF